MAATDLAKKTDLQIWFDYRPEFAIVAAEDLMLLPNLEVIISLCLGVAAKEADGSTTYPFGHRASSLLHFLGKLPASGRCAYSYIVPRRHVGRRPTSYPYATARQGTVSGEAGRRCFNQIASANACSRVHRERIDLCMCVSSDKIHRLVSQGRLQHRPLKQTHYLSSLTPSTTRRLR